MIPNSTEEIARRARDGRAIDRALAAAFRRTVIRHRNAGVPLAVWRDGRVVDVPADEVELPPADDDVAGNGGPGL
jgi:hypothetical protein